MTMTACINGAYDLALFEKGVNENIEPTRIRAVVQNTLLQFVNEMQEGGHALHVVDHTIMEKRKGIQRVISQNDVEEKVMNIMKTNRGRELIGLFNPLICSSCKQHHGRAS